MTEAEYFAADHASISRLDFIGGRVVDVRELASGGYPHSRIVANLVTALHIALRSEGYRVHGSDLRLGLAGGNFAYPDALVEAGEPCLRREGPSDTLLNPVAVYEVVTPSSVIYDRGVKLEAYLATPSIREVVTIGMHRPGYRRHVRAGESWLRSVTLYPKGISAASVVQTMGVEIPMAEIYAGVELPAD